MEKEVLKEPMFVEEIIAIIRSGESDAIVAERLQDYHENDIAQSLEDIDDELKEKISPILDADVRADIQLIHSYEEDEIGSLITTNYISIRKDLSVKQATHELIRQAGDNDNISTIYVTDEQSKFCGAIDLKDLIIARETVDLDSLIVYSYPYILDHEKISDSIEKIKDYAEDSLPVLNSKKEIIGILTAQDIIEAVVTYYGLAWVLLIQVMSIV